MLGLPCLSRLDLLPGGLGPVRKTHLERLAVKSERNCSWSDGFKYNQGGLGLNKYSDWRIEHLERQIKRTERGLVTAERLNKPQWLLQALQGEILRLRYEKALVYHGLMKAKNY